MFVIIWDFEEKRCVGDENESVIWFDEKMKTEILTRNDLTKKSKYDPG